MIEIGGKGIRACQQVNVGVDGQHGNQAVLLYTSRSDVSGVGNVIVVV